jgi:hypothetical protein
VKRDRGKLLGRSAGGGRGVEGLGGFGWGLFSDLSINEFK